MRNSESLDLLICAMRGNLYLSIPNIILPKLISIFNCNEKGELYIIQTADDEYFKRLENVGNDIVKDYPQTYKPIQFLKGISINEKFIIVSDNLMDDSSLNKYTEINKKIYEINGVEYPITGGKIADFYNIYYWGDKKVYIGEADKKKRVCRFCGKDSSSTITFKNKSHAISESLGNRLLYCNEECDSCNTEFGVIETDFFNIHHLMSSLFGLRGKDGIHSFKGKSIEIDNKDKNGLISIKADISTEIINGLTFTISEHSLKYSGQNIYRCLCKFAISFIDNRYLERLSDTILWIRHKKTVNYLPTIWERTCARHEQPMIGLYIKKEHIENELPEFVVRLYVLNIEYLFVLPIVDSAPVVLSESTKSELKEIFTLSRYKEIDLSSDEKNDFQMSFSFKLEEGTEIITINKSEYDMLSDNERILKFPKASAFRIINDIES